MAKHADPQRTCARCHATSPAAAAFCTRCGASTAPGPVLTGYTILRIIGQGGAAAVYLARQESLDREVAIKVLRRDVDEAKVWERFRREARTIARLSGQPHVVTVYTAGRTQAGEPYLVSEYLDRGSLGDLIAAEGPLPAAKVARVGVAIADALVAAHGVGILHRDVKPGNVLLGHDGRVKLGDFGIARLLAAQSGALTDVIAFTPEHVAPEILRGQPDDVWSDLYGLASTLATALIGEPLFRRRPDERMESLLSRKLMAPAPQLPASVPPALAGLLGQGLDPDPSRRPSLLEFRNELAAAADVLGARVLPQPAAVPAQLPPTTAPTMVRDGGDTVARADRDTRAVPAQSELGAPPRRPRRRRFEVPAFFIALVAAALVVALLARNRGDRGDASNTTSVIVLVPTSGSSTAQPPLAPIPAPTAPGVTSTGAAVSIVAPTTPFPVAAAATPAGEELAITTAEEAETFVRDYYDAVAAGDYQRSWSQLAPEFQRGMARSYDYYVGFWDENDIDVGDVELVDVDQERAIVNVELRWNDSGTAELNQFTMRPDEDGDLLIASQRNLGDG